MISVNSLTLTYPSGKGVFDLNFLVEQGYDPVLLVKDGRTWGLNLIYGSVAVVLFVSAVLIFKKKRLPL